MWSLLYLIFRYELQVSFIKESGINDITIYPHIQIGWIDKSPSI
jgi:hypothetical protein